MATPLRKTSEKPQDPNEIPVPPSELAALAQQQEAAIQASPFLSQLVPQIRQLDRRKTIRQLLDPRYNRSRIADLVQARARQLTAEHMADAALGLMAELMNVPEPSKDESEDSPEYQEILAAHRAKVGDEKQAVSLLEGYRAGYERNMKVAVEIAKVQIPRLQEEIAELARERIGLEFAVENAPEIQPTPPDPESSRKLEELGQQAWDAAQANEDVIKMDVEKDEPEDVDMIALVSSLPKE